MSTSTSTSPEHQRFTVTLPDGCTFPTDGHLLPLRLNNLDPAGAVATTCRCQDDARAYLAAWLEAWEPFVVAHRRDQGWTPERARREKDALLDHGNGLGRRRLQQGLQPSVRAAIAETFRLQSWTRNRDAEGGQQVVEI